MPRTVKSVATLDRPHARIQALSDSRKLEEIERLTKKMMREHLPTAEYGCWYFRWSRAKRVFGQTDYDTQEISLSKQWALVRPIEETVITILHEIAHARLPFWVAHGPEWVAEAQALGIPGDRCSRTDHEIPAKWIATCGTCGRKSRRHRINEQMKRGDYACKDCCAVYSGGEWDRRFMFKFVQQY